MTRLKRFWWGDGSEGGQAIILIAISMLAMLMAVGLAIDAGQLYSARRSMVEAADAAAYAAAVALYQGGTQTDAFSAAAADATRNGFTNGVNGVSITVRQPTASPYNTASYVEVLISQAVRTSLVPAQSSFTNVAVSAIAGAQPLPKEYTMIALDSSWRNDAFKGDAAITINGGGIFVNSTAWNAVNTSSSFNITCPAAQPCNIGTAGGQSGLPAAQPGSPHYYNGPLTGQAQISDPYAGYPKPSTAGLTDWGAVDVSGGNVTLAPGIYKGIKASGGANIYLQPGTYIVREKGIDISGGGELTMDPSAPLTDGVLLFNTNKNYPTAGGGCDKIKITGGGVVGLRPLSAAQSSQYAGMLIYQDPACTDEMELSGHADLTAGTIYLPTAKFKTSGTVDVTIGNGQIVAKTLELGGATVSVTYTPSGNASSQLPRLAK